jgi:uncharacterized protein (DUF2147 family)
MTSISRITPVAVLAALLLVPSLALADDPVLAPDAILGIWETEHQDNGWSRIEITEKDGKFHGQIVWLKNPLYDAGEVIGMDGQPRVDRKNPDEGLQGRPILGLEVMSDFVHNGRNKWEGGRIYDPENGKTYHCKATMRDARTLEIFGYVKVGFVNMGRNTTWVRVTGQD